MKLDRNINSDGQGEYALEARRMLRQGSQAVRAETETVLEKDFGVMSGHYPQDHPCDDVQQAITRLNDALCMWERSTGRESVMIIREAGGWNHRSMSGKPGIPDDVSDEQLLKVLPK